jgi:hypothetical protein
MLCPSCVATLAGAPALCPRCGHPILEDDRTVRLSFDGDSIELYGWLILGLLSLVLVFPLAWTLAAFARWFCRNLRLDGGTTVAFTGTGPQILGWMLLSCVLPLPFLVRHAIHGPAFLNVPIAIAVFFLSPLISLSILRWTLSKFELSSGPPLHFDGSYPDYLCGQMLMAIASGTVIGWAWVVASFYGWVAEHTRGDDIAFHCDAAGWDVLWRTVAAVLGSLPLVTIPWMFMWYYRWLVGCITLTRGATP